MKPTIFISAETNSEAYDKIFENHMQDVLRKFIESGKQSIVVEYGNCRLVDYKGSYDCYCEAYDSFELEWDDFVKEIEMDFSLLDVLHEFFKKEKKC